MNYNFINLLFINDDIYIYYLSIKNNIYNNKYIILKYNIFKINK